MKKTDIYSIRLAPDLRGHLEKQAKMRKIGLAKYIKAAIKKGSGYKEKPLL
jgi:predicted DNA-binding protein